MAKRLWAQLAEWSRAWARHPLPFLLAILIGAVAGVAYTSGPLHTAKNWRLDYLDTQLVIQNQRVRSLEIALARRDLSSRGSLAPAEAVELRAELVRAATREEQKGERADAAEDKAAKAYASREHWRSKSREAETELNRCLEENVERRAERDGLLARLSAVGSSSAPPPAAADPNSTVLASELELMVGESWSSPDGRVHFDVVDVDAEMASLRGSWQPSEASLERVSAGGQLSARFSDTLYRITVMAVSPYRSLTIRAVSGPP